MSGGGGDLLKLHLSPRSPGAPLPFLPCTLTKTICLRHLDIGWHGSGGATAPVKGVGPSCTVTSSLIPCLQQELAQSGVDFCTSGRKHTCMLREIYMLAHMENEEMQVWVCFRKGICTGVSVLYFVYAHTLFVCGLHAWGIIMIHWL